MNSLFSPADFTDLPEFGVGHYTNTDAMTGCTCFVSRGAAEEGAVCGVDVRGGGPATRETDLLKPENMVQKANAIMLSGGSAFGLGAANGAMECLSNSGMGFSVGPVRVPIIPAACIFDLLIGKPEWPSEEDGAFACKQALDMDGDPEMGSVGAGTGATIGKMGLPEQFSKSGFGWAGAKFAGISVISCVAVNAAGNVMNPDGSWLSGAHDAEGNIIDPLQAAMGAATALQSSSETGHTANTTIGVVLTNASLSQAQATKVAQQAQDGYARSIKPVHTLNDGDTIFVMASGTADAGPLSAFLPDMVGIMSADTMEDAIRAAVLAA